MLQRDYYLAGPGQYAEAIPSGYSFVAILNNTPYNITLYRSSNDTSLGSRFGIGAPWSHSTIPLPPGLTGVTVAWEGATESNKVTLIYSEFNLNLNASFAPKNGIYNVDMADNPNRQLGIVTAKQGSPSLVLSDSWPVKLTDGANPVGTAANPLVVAEGTPGTNANGWPVKVTDGTNVLGTVANPLVTTGGGAGGTVTQGPPNAAVANGWPVKLTDGTNVLGTASNPVFVAERSTQSVLTTISSVNIALPASSTVNPGDAPQLGASVTRRVLVIHNASVGPVWVYYSDSPGADQYLVALKASTAVGDGTGGTWTDERYRGQVWLRGNTGAIVKVTEYTNLTA